MLIISHYIAKHEIKPIHKVIAFKDIQEASRKVIKGLSTEVKSPLKSGDFRFFKVRIGPRNNARMIVFLITKTQKVVPVLIRLKKDKIFGMNMAMNNPKVAEQIDKNLTHILNDIETKRYEEFPL